MGVVAEADDALGLVAERHRGDQDRGDPVDVADQPEREQGARLVGDVAVADPEDDADVLVRFRAPSSPPRCSRDRPR